MYHSARNYLPNARWLFLFDGVHQIQEDMRPGYEEYKKILKSRINNFEWANCEYLEFEQWGHQASMIREALRRDHVRTPLVLWLEHDFAFNYLPIDFQGIVNSLLENEFCYVRFALPEENWISIQALNTPTSSRFVPVLETKNYSSLPHVCRINFLQRLMLEFIHGNDHLECLVTEGIAFKEPEWRLALYTPAGHLDRVYSLDGRQGRKKPEVTF